ncbi:hypothetical protein [Hymenobacter ruricola]|uniref:T9SS type A sorting domain-containing protein n=1 Tax=Hymenobacter ruricola TaxID=2791023 RepID=A0ABS0I7R0_9BACT|nr:hypothetical protein [Hymenobacter ruricola]MBF9222801.1 hypothetical protein [Hymenobacter ruricola]
MVWQRGGGLTARAQAPAALAGPAAIQCRPSAATTGNLLSNSNFESLLNCTVVQPRNMANSSTSKLCFWWDQNNTASDPFNACATGNAQPDTARYGVPDNLYGSQAARSGNGYVGFRAYARYGNNGSPVVEHRSYAGTPITTPLAAGRLYYAEYWVSLADASASRVSSLGMALSRQYPAQTTDGLLTQVDQVVNDNAAVLDDRAGWQRVRGLFAAAGGEQYFTIGYFEPAAFITFVPGATTNPQAPAVRPDVQYYADDALLVQVPQAGPDFVTDCGKSVTLPVDGLALPAGVGATYRWTSSTDPTFSSATLQTTVPVLPATLPTVYTLTVTLPGQGTTQSQVTMNVRCCITPGTGFAMTVLDQGNYTAQDLQLQPNTNYYVPLNLRLTQGVFTLPESSTLYLGQDVSVFVDDQATLELAGGHLTAACSHMWDGVYVRAGGNLLSHPGPGGGRPGIAHSLQGVVFLEAQPTPLQLADTDFLFNYQSITFQDLQQGDRQGRVTGCTFDSAPLGMLPPYQYQSATDFSYSLRHVAVLDARLWDNIAFDGNQLKRGMFGVFAAGASVLSPLTNNRFENNYVAGVCTDGASVVMFPLTGNTFQLPTAAVHDANPPQLAAAYAQAPSSSPEETYGVLANGQIATAQGNQFSGPAVLRLNDFPVHYRQVGISATAFPNTNSLPRNNYFTNLYEGLRLQLKVDGSITENQFEGCVYGIHLVGPGAPGYGPNYRVQLQCNTFVWPAASRFGSASYPRGIFIDANYQVTLTGAVPNATPPSLAATLLKNYFVNYNTPYITDVWNDPSNAPFAYDTFFDVANGNQFGMAPLTTVNVIVSSQGNIPITSSNDCANDGYPNAGIQARTTPNPPKGKPVTIPTASNTLESLAPNPASDRIVLRYHLTLTDADQPAAIVVRSLLNGAVVQELPLSAAGTEATLPTQALPNGVYAVSLLVNGRTVATRRLLVNH